MKSNKTVEILGQGQRKRNAAPHAAHNSYKLKTNPETNKVGLKIA